MDGPQKREEDAPFARQAGNGGGPLSSTSDAARFGLETDPGLARARMTEKDALKLDAILEVGRERLEYRERQNDRTRAFRVTRQKMKLFDDAAASGDAFDLPSLERQATRDVAEWDAKQLDRIKLETRFHAEAHIDRALGHVRERSHDRRR